jgi:CDP-6-deoxy-D-xylo-4-hexulose-3-dehydrase
MRQLAAEYYKEAFPARAFQPGESPVPVSGRVFDEREIQTLVDSALDFWLTTGRFADDF